MVNHVGFMSANLDGDDDRSGRSVHLIHVPPPNGWWLITSCTPTPTVITIYLGRDAVQPGLVQPHELFKVFSILRDAIALPNFYALGRTPLCEIMGRIFAMITGNIVFRSC